MHLKSYRIQNYRRLRDVQIELEPAISVFVGSNNSGKTSATQVISAFVAASKDRITLYDFSSTCWKDFDEIGDSSEEEATGRRMPALTLDLWFAVKQSDLAIVRYLLPSLDWADSQVGIRIEYAAINETALLDLYRTTRDVSLANARSLPTRENEAYVPWPQRLTDFLKKELSKLFDFRYYVLDPSQFDDSFVAAPGYAPQPLNVPEGGASFVRQLIKVDNLSAQRHLADPEGGTTASGGRSEDLSKRLSRFYERNLKQHPEDHHALRALFDSENGLNLHLATVFKETLEQLSRLGYPGVNNPRLEIRSALNPESVLRSQDARIHYAIGDGDDAVRLPDSYNGLGFKNLIYMVVEILDLHAAWKTDSKSSARIHLIFIEEPEAHLHAQLQQVFIRKVLDLVDRESNDADGLTSQLIVTTHSSHVLYERGFRAIRYFKKSTGPNEQMTSVLNLSKYYDNTIEDRDFLERYLKLTHCDLFFADAAILVEGNVERLLLPVMIERVAPELRSACLAILEVGGAFAHRFRSLIEFLGITTLIITDLDSVSASGVTDNDDDSEEHESTEFEVPNHDPQQPAERRRGRSCLPSVTGAETSNQSLISWIPRMRTIAELLDATPEQKSSAGVEGTTAVVRVAYQTPVSVRWRDHSADLCGRTFEVAFGLQNAAWCQDVERKHLGLKLKGNFATPTEFAEGLHKRVGGKSFDKTSFALGLLTEPTDQWEVPNYIREGLEWLVKAIPNELPAVSAELAVDAVEVVV